MNIFLLSSVILSITSFLTGVFVITQNHTQKITKIYSLYCLTNLIAGISLYKTQINQNNASYHHLLIFTLLISSALITHFIIELTKPNNKILPKIFYSISGFFAVLNIIDFFNIIKTKLLLKNNIPTIQFNTSFMQENIGLIVLCLYYIITTIFISILLFKYNQSKNKKNHLIIIATILWFLGVFGILIQTPISIINAIISLLISIAIPIIGYVIIRYYTPDPSYVIRKAIVYTILSLIIFIGYTISILLQQKFRIFSISNQHSLLFVAIISLTLSIILKNSYEFLTKFINKVFHKTDYDYQKALNEISKAISASVEYQQIANLVSNFSTQIMKIKNIVLARYSQTTYNFIEISEKPQLWILDINAPLIKLITKIKTIVLIDDLFMWVNSQDSLSRLYTAGISSGDLKKIIEDFNAQNIVGVMPLISKNKLIGFWGIGRKISEENYKDEEIEFLNTLANQITASLENATLYQNIKKTEKAIREERDKTQSVITHLTDGLIVTDMNHNIILVNPTAEKMFPNQQLMGQILPAILQHKLNEDGSEPNYPIYSEIKTEEPKQILQITTTPYLNQNEEQVGYIKHIHNITREKEIDKIKSDFIRTAAHKLRTPLSATKWILKMLAEGDLGAITADQKQFLDKGYNSNERMISVVNKLLSASEIEEGKFDFYFQETQITDIIQEVLSEMKPLSEEKEQKITYEQDRYIAKINADRSKIKIVIQSLLLNSIMYTPKGGAINIKIENLRKEIKFTITDNGVGVPDYQQNKLFTKFMRGDNILKQETEGNGLDLFISKNIVEAHKGKIDYIDMEKQGSTFYFTIPTIRE